MKKAVVSLFSANAFAFAIAGLSFIAYSRLLTAQQFGLYAVALSLSAFLTLLLDGGLKNTIIKLDRDLEASEQTVITAMMSIAAALLTVALVFVAPRLHRTAQLEDLHFLGMFVFIALASYPFFTIPTTKLERRLQYQQIAWIESVSILIERAAPALLLIWAKQGLNSFVWALAISRIFRIVALSLQHPVQLSRVNGKTWKASSHLFREGGWIQLGSLSSVLRDNLHTVLVGPLFGKEWIGYYAWVIQLCLISSQVFAGISARIALPILAQCENFRERWQKSLYQVRLLIMFTVPVLFFVWYVLPALNARVFAGKWTPALVLVPLLFLRMVPSLATSPLGPLVMVQSGGSAFAKASSLWMFLELVAASVMILLVGPTGLAWSYAIIVWFGLAIIISTLPGSRALLMFQVIRSVVARPSVIVPLIAAIATGVFIPAASPFAAIRLGPWFYVCPAAVVLTSYLLEPELRALVMGHRDPRSGVPLGAPIAVSADARSDK